MYNNFLFSITSNEELFLMVKLVAALLEVVNQSVCAVLQVVIYVVVSSPKTSMLSLTFGEIAEGGDNRSNHRRRRRPRRPSSPPSTVVKFRESESEPLC